MATGQFSSAAAGALFLLRLSRNTGANERLAERRWLVWIAIALLLYYTSFFARPVFDDLSHAELAAREGWQLWHIGPIFFRPLEPVLIGLNWMLERDNFWIVRLLRATRDGRLSRRTGL